MNKNNFLIDTFLKRLVWRCSYHMKKKKVHTEIEQTLANTRLTDITVAQKLENIKYG